MQQPTIPDYLIPDPLHPLHEVVERELTRMLGRSLYGTPPGDEIYSYIALMEGDLCAARYMDVSRIEDAFNYYGQNAKRWPTTLDIKETIRSRSNLFSNERREIESDKAKKRRKEDGVEKTRLIREIVADSSKEVLKKAREYKIEPINEEDHKRLSEEDSVEGILYRDMMRN